MAQKSRPRVCSYCDEPAPPCPSLRIVQADVRIRSPLHLFDSGSRHQPGMFVEDIDRALVRAGRPGLSPAQIRFVQEAARETKGSEALRRELAAGDENEAATSDWLLGSAVARLRLVHLIESLGVDGFVYRNRYEDAGHVSWIAVRDNQILARRDLDPSRDVAELCAHATALGARFAITDEESRVGTADWRVCQEADRALNRVWEGRRELGNGLAVVRLAPRDGDHLRPIAESLREWQGPVFADSPGRSAIILTADGARAAFFGPAAVTDRIVARFGGGVGAGGAWIGGGGDNLLRSVSQLVSGHAQATSPRGKKAATKCAAAHAAVQSGL